LSNNLKTRTDLPDLVVVSLYIKAEESNYLLLNLSKMQGEDA
jgi:hypothetical protein